MAKTYQKPKWPDDLKDGDEVTVRLGMFDKMNGALSFPDPDLNTQSMWGCQFISVKRAPRTLKVGDPVFTKFTKTRGVIIGIDGTDAWIRNGAETFAFKLSALEYDHDASH